MLCNICSTQYLFQVAFSAYPEVGPAYFITFQMLFSTSRDARCCMAITWQYALDAG